MSLPPSPQFGSPPTLVPLCSPSSCQRDPHRLVAPGSRYDTEQGGQGPPGRSGSLGSLPGSEGEGGFHMHETLAVFQWVV